MAAVKERLDKHDKRIASMRDLMREDIKMVQEIRQLTLDTRRDLRRLATMHVELSEAQTKTDASLRAFIDSMRGGGNGHQKKSID